MPRQFTHIELHASGRADPTRTRMVCEAPGCPNEFVMADGVSFITTIALSGAEARYSAQCPDEQHFCCSWQCAASAQVVCIRDHLTPLHAAMLAKARANQQPN